MLAPSNISKKKKNQLPNLDKSSPEGNTWLPDSGSIPRVVSPSVGWL